MQPIAPPVETPPAPSPPTEVALSAVRDQVAVLKAQLAAQQSEIGLHEKKIEGFVREIEAGFLRP